MLKVIPGVAVTGLTHDLYTIEVGGRNLRGFAGVTVPAIDGIPGFSEPKRIGTEIEDVTFGLSIMAATSVSGITVPGIAAVLPTYVAAKATVGRAAEVGFDSFITRLAAVGRPIPTIEDVTVEINTSFLPFAASYAPLQAVASAALPMPALDLTGTAFAADGPGLEIATGDPARPVVLDFAEEVIAIDVGYFDVAMFSFFDAAAGSDLTPNWSAKGVDLVNLGIVAASASMSFAPPSLQVAGNLSLAKRGGERVTLSDGREITVSSLGFAMSDVVGFQGAGQYWGRNPTTGRIDPALPVDSRAIGVAIDDLDIGAVFMLRMPEGLSPVPAVYVGATATLGEARLVGVEELANARLTNFTLDVNLSASLDFKVVDFSKSTHAVVAADGSLTTVPGYAIAGSEVVLTHDKAVLETQGSVDVNLFDVVVLQGDFLFAGSGSSVLLYIDGTSRLGPEQTPWITSDVEAFLRIDSRGVVLCVMLTTDPIRIGTGVEIVPASLSLLVNTTGEDASFTIPEHLRRPGGPASITVSAVPPGETERAGYVAASGSGRTRLGSGFTLDGSFDLLLKRDVSTFTFDATLDLPVIEPLLVKGRLTYLAGNDGGLFGSLVAAPAGGLLVSTPAFSIGTGRGSRSTRRPSSGRCSRSPVPATPTPTATGSCRGQSPPTRCGSPARAP